MSSTPSPAPSRNSPCPCGSGRKYKHCCGARLEAAPPETLEINPVRPTSSARTVVIGTIVAVAVAIAVMVFVTNPRRSTPVPAALPSADAGSPSTADVGGGGTPEPWHYDATLNRHWDPTPGHMHWHNGPPPVIAGLPLSAGTTPAPWFHDTVNNRYWDPTPGHMHWHDGPPPPVSERPQ